jgi:hypothetical protein
MKRRSLLFAGVSVFALAHMRLAMADGFFHWRKPGGDPYQGTLEQALQAFSDIVPADVRAELLDKVRRGQGTRTNVFAGWRVTRMMFGRHQPVPNVIVDASDLAAWGSASTEMMMYTVERYTSGQGRLYALFRPTVCNNWCIKVGTLRVCELDTLICDQGCQKLRAKQYIP